MGDANGIPEVNPGSVARTRSVVVAARILLLLLAAGAVLAAVEMTARGRRGDDASERYVCPMHAEVRSADPGECPICGMALVPARRGAGVPDQDLPNIADLAAVENVRRHNIIDFVRKRSLLSTTAELRGPAWVDDDGAISAVFYDDQIAALGADERGTFFATQTPQVSYRVRRAEDPVRPWGRSTSRIRFRFDGGRRRAEPGEVGWLWAAPRPRQVLTVPASAVLQSPEGPYVLVSVGGLRFAKRRIEIGETFLRQGFAVVLSGLRANERVVARATFFIDADRRLGGEAPDLGSVAP